MRMITEAELCKNNFGGKHKLAIWTDRADFIVGNINIPDLHKLLELRAFDETGEARYYRSYVGEDFFMREISDETERSNEDFDGSYEEIQYLDIDTERAKELPDGEVYAIGGGAYHLPVPGVEKLKVKYYYKFDDNGVAYVCDKRMAGFVKKHEGGEEKK